MTAPTTGDDPRCAREDLVHRPGMPTIVRCQKGTGHDGPHVFTHFWYDPRDERP